MKIVSGSWTEFNNKTYVDFYVRTPESKSLVRVDPEMNPYMLMPKSVYAKKCELFNTESFGIVRTSELAAENGTFTKIEFRSPRQLSYFLSIVGEPDCYEADLSFTKRVMIDLGIKLDVDKDFNSLEEQDTQYRKLYWDIECDNRHGFPRAHLDKIISIATIDDKGDIRVFSIKNSSEKQVLNEFVQYAKQFDLIIGWNSDRFDLPYLQKRCEVNSVPLKRLGVNWLDLQDLYKRTGFKVIETLPSYSLDYVSNFELGETKIKTDKRLWKLFIDDYEKFIQYNITDAVLIKKIDEKREITDTIVQMSSFAGSFPEECKYYSRIVDMLLLRACFSKSPRYILRTKPRWVENLETESTYEGALTIQPIPGAYKNVAVFDFKALYPSIIRAFNVSVDTLDPKNGKVIVPDFPDAKFSSKPGIIPMFLEELNKKRDAYKALRDKEQVGTPLYRLYHQKQYIMKTISNTTYGYLGFTKSRAYDKRIAGAVTAAGRFLIKTVKELAESRGLKVLYGDTDSIFVQLTTKATPTPELLSLGKALETDLNNGLKLALKKTNANINYIMTVFEKLGSDLIFVQNSRKERAPKKRYVLRLVWKDGKETNQTVISGLESVRSDWSALARRTQRHLIDSVLAGESKESIRDYLLDLRNKLFSGAFDADLVISKTFMKLPSDYKIPTLSSIVAADAEKKGIDSYFTGQKVPYIIAGYKEGRLFAIHPKELESVQSKIPIYTYYWVKQISEMSLRLLLSVFPSFTLDEMTPRWYEKNKHCFSLNQKTLTECVPK